MGKYDKRKETDFGNRFSMNDKTFKKLAEMAAEKSKEDKKKK